MSAKDPKRPKGMPETARFLGRYPVGDLCADDLFMAPATKRLARLVDKDDDGGSLLMLKVRYLDEDTPYWVHIRNTVRLNIWAD